MYTKYKNKIFLILILISIIFSTTFAIGRHKVEKNYRHYDIVAGYDDFARLGYGNGDLPVEYFKKLYDRGLTTVSFNEVTIAGLKSFPGSSVSTQIIGNDLIVTGSDKELNFIKEGLSTLKDKRKMELSNGRLVVEGRPSDIVSYELDAYDTYENKMKGSLPKGSMLEYVGLGFDSDLVNEIKDIGIDVTLRPVYFPNVQDSRLTMERFINSVKSLNPNQRYIVFSGKEFYKNTEEDTKIQEDFEKFLSENKIAIGLIEASTQRGHLSVNGLDPIIKKDSTRKLRAFTTWDYLASQYDYEIPFHQEGQELTNVYYRAISERNISVIFLSGFIKSQTAITDPDAYGRVIGSLEERMADKGYSLGDVNPMGSWQVSSYMKVPVALGSAAASILLLELIFHLPAFASMTLLILGVLASIGFFALGKLESLGNVLFNLNSIIVFPLLSICYILENYKQIRNRRYESKLGKIFFHGSLILLISIAITMVGALHEVSFMSGTNYLLEINIFRGVKISQLLPLLCSIFIYTAYIGFDEKIHREVRIEPREIKRVMTSKIELWQAALGLIFLLILAAFVVRGGNTSAKVPKPELLMRNLMEQYLPVRPRTKSIIAGYPAIFILVYLAYKKKGDMLGLVLCLLATIGMTDIVNTFSHIRTPIKISFTRIGVEIVVALVISFIVLLIADLIRKGYEKYID
ncbi:DUF5693 family protein [Peptoniphilus catoniae]|uniref:DUF5693 family protein n=1 Tax=Peptoniphilus catoniae TaxID=1660341 RepID=UPI0010FCFCCD|nr:DUF5693 family protein [Peptoniphilus catoniae]